MFDLEFIYKIYNDAKLKIYQKNDIKFVISDQK